ECVVTAKAVPFRCEYRLYRFRENAEAGLELLAVFAAESKCSVVVEQDGVVAVFVGAETADAIEIDDCGAMDAAEECGVEVLFEIGEAAAEQVRARADVQRGVVVGGLDPVDLREINKGNLSG